MRLLNTTTLELHTYYDDPPPYIILSHTWQDGEITLQELEAHSNKEKAGWVKVNNFCLIARERGFEWAWIDTCCIDKTNGVELSEAINSMYRYYKKSTLCIVYLVDVHTIEGDPADKDSDFRSSRWWTRGWTLQELIAPGRLEFIADDWSISLGKKDELRGVIQTITGINSKVLRARPINSYPIATILSWAAGRECTRKEDKTYCLLGLLDINMPLLYGEGERAFIRLQEEIIRTKTDDSILTWSTKPLLTMHGLFPKPGLFAPVLECFRYTFPPATFHHQRGQHSIQPKIELPESQYLFSATPLFSLVSAGLQMRRKLYIVPKKANIFDKLRSSFAMSDFDIYLPMLGVVAKSGRGKDSILLQRIVGDRYSYCEIRHDKVNHLYIDRCERGYHLHDELKDGFLTKKGYDLLLRRGTS